MKAELKLKNDKIDKLEKIVYKKKEAVATQVRLREDFLINASYHLSADPENTASCRKIGRAKGESRQEPPQHQHQSRVHVTRWVTEHVSHLEIQTKGQIVTRHVTLRHRIHDMASGHETATSRIRYNIQTVTSQTLWIGPSNKKILLTSDPMFPFQIASLQDRAMSQSSLANTAGAPAPMTTGKASVFSDQSSPDLCP